MFYNFPIINNIDDVLPHIKDFDEIIAADGNGFTWIDYVVDTGETFSRKHAGWEMRRECRGLLFDNDGNIISRPFHKFFNVNQLEETQHNVIDFNRNHLLMIKEDGSMVRPFNWKGEMWWATRKGVSETIHNMKKIVPDYFENVFFENLSDRFVSVKKLLMNNKTPIFEYTGPSNHHVVEYEEDRIVLLAVRDNITGKYENIYDMKDELKGVELVEQRESPETLSDLIDVIRDVKGIEGVVLTFGDEYYKIKGEDYVLKHKTKDKVTKHRHVWESILAGNLDDILPLLSKIDQDSVNDMEKEFWELRAKVISHYEKISNDLFEKTESRKDFAVSHIQKDKLVNQCVFGLYDGKSVEMAIDNHILKNIGKDSLFDKMKEDFEKL